MKGPPSRLCRFFLAASAIVVILVGAAPASADRGLELLEHERCVYREGGPPGPAGNSLLVVTYDAVVLFRKGRSIRVYAPGVPCRGRAATVGNTDEIIIEGALEEGLTINESDGRFGPGASGNGIKIRYRGPRLTLIGTHRRDHVVLGSPGGKTAIDLDAGHRRPLYDVFLPEGVPRLIKVEGGPGGDLLDSRRLRRMGDPSGRHRLILDGGAGRDTLLGSPGNDWRLGDGPGADLVRGGGGDDTIWFGHGHDTLIGGAGDDEITYSAFERFRRSLPPDASDRIFAGPGNDLVADENRHRDLLDCGSGIDSVHREPRDRPLANCERKWY
jgi:hypothetical protein